MLLLASLFLHVILNSKKPFLISFCSTTHFTIMKHHSFKIIALWSLFVFIDSVIAFGIAECWVRLFIPVKNICYLVDNKIGVKYCPNQRTYGHVEEGYSNITITNSIGSHDVKRTEVKDNAVFRIHIYGDSMIAGMGVQIEETIPSLVEKYLNSYDLPVKTEVLNMAVGTEATNGQIVTYEEIGTKFDADLIICYFMDDFGDNVLELSGNKHAPYYRIDENNELVYYPPVPKDTGSFMGKFKRQWCFFYRLVANKVTESNFYHNYKILKKRLSLYLKEGLISNHKSNEETKNYDSMKKQIYINRSWPLTLRLIKYFKDRVESNGAQFIVSDGRIFDENVGSVYSNKDFEHYCILNDINYIPSYKILAEITSTKDSNKYFLVDGHPNQLGNKMISKFLSEGIKKFMIKNNMKPLN